MIDKFLGVAGALAVLAAGKSAILDHDTWDVWVPMLIIAALAFVVLVEKR
ncbi:hypothetical protein [Mycolicibacterium mageritense]|nr:hypothetical protein [Mycolicibacterium mageritense]